MLGISDCMFLGYWYPLRYVFSNLGSVGAWSTFLTSLPWPRFPAQAWLQYKFLLHMISHKPGESGPIVHQPSFFDTGMSQDSIRFAESFEVRSIKKLIFQSIWGILKPGHELIKMHAFLKSYLSLKTNHLLTVYVIQPPILKHSHEALLNLLPLTHLRVTWLWPPTAPTTASLSTANHDSFEVLK
jgi:hypothetical protein